MQPASDPALVAVDDSIAACYASTLSVVEGTVPYSCQEVLERASAGADQKVGIVYYTVAMYIYVYTLYAYIHTYIHTLYSGIQFIC